MKIPKRIQPLIDDGLVDEVVSRLMSGKEADIYVVRCQSELRCAKVYKEAAKRNFKQAVKYREGRKVRNSRRSRAMEKGSRFGREQQEEIWQSTELRTLRLLADAGVRVPRAYTVLEDVLLMELITDGEGQIAPRLCDVSMSSAQALEDHAIIMQYVVRMLAAGLVHGDLSEFNVLLGEYGPVIIDLPQAVDAAGNNNARSMLERDVNNMSRYFAQYAPELSNTHYGKEIWSLFESGKLDPNSQLTGEFTQSTQAADVDGVLAEIEAVMAEELERRSRVLEAAGSE